MVDVWLSKFPEHCVLCDYEDIIDSTSKAREKILNFCGIEVPDTACPQPYDDRGFSKPYEIQIAMLRSDPVWDDLDILETIDRNKILDGVNNQKQACELMKYQLEPEVRFECNNAEIYVSKKFHLVDRNREHAVIYVKIENQVHPRLVYQSASSRYFQSC